jgi:FAD/FMN-containing dehydrogenase
MGHLELWNAAASVRPAVVRRCEDTSQVSQAVREARASGLPLSVRGGGHDWAGRAVRDGGLVIDLRGMRSVEVGGDVASVGGGATSADVIAAAAATGWSAATGTVGAVGMAGLTLGGGYGPFCGIAGLAADNLLGAEVVLADGTVAVAGEDGDPDLLWALRGGGGNFGVVTSMRVRLHRVPRVYRGTILFPAAQGADVLSGYGEIAADVPDELAVQAAVMSMPGGGTPVLLVSPTWSGDPAEGAQWVKRVEGLGTPVMSEAAVIEYGDMLRGADQMFARDDRRYEIRTRNLPRLTAEAASAIIAAGMSRTSPLSALNLHHFHGAAARVPVTGTAFGTREEHFMTEIIACWRPGTGHDADGQDAGHEAGAAGPGAAGPGIPDPGTASPDDGTASPDAGAAGHRRWADDVADLLAPHALPGGYPNLLGADRAEQAAHAYGPNAVRLLALKDAYDPDHVFTAIPLPPRR